MTHVGYILAAYGVSAAVLLALIASVGLDLRFTRRRLAELEDQGIRRRPEPR